MSVEPIASRVADFLQVDQQLIQDINNDVLGRIEEKLEDLRKQKSENLRITATLDQLKSQSENKLESFKIHISQLAKALEDGKDERLHFEEEKRRLIEGNSQVTKRIIELEQEIEVERQQKELADASKQDIAESLNEKIEELSSTKAKLNEAQGANKELRQKVVNTETELQTQQALELRSKSEILRMEQEITLLRENNDWLTNQLNTKTVQLNEFRESTISELQDSQLKVSNMESELEIARTSNQKLKQSVHSLHEQLEQKLSENKEIKDEYNFSKQELTKEMSLKQRMIDALEKHMESLKKEMDATKNNMDSSYFTEKERDELIEELNAVKYRLDASESNCIKLKETIDELTSNIKLEDSEVGNTTASSEKSVSVIPKLYGDLGMLKKQLVIEKRQKEELKMQVEAFVVELEHKIPVLNSFKERSEMLERELNEVTILLESTGKDRDQKSSQLDYLKATVKSYETQIASLSKQRVDLAHQIQYLLVNESIKSDDGGPLSAEELQFVKNLTNSQEITKTSDTQGIITDRLVEFRSVVELQQKNSELLSTIRNLADELERREAENKSQIQVLEDETVREAKETILTLHDHAQNLENQLVILSKERDAYKALSVNASSGTNTPKAITYPSPDNDDKVKDLETRLTAVIQEAENNAKEWSSENSNLRKKLYEISLNFESEKTSRTLAEDRLNLLQSTLELSKRQCEELQKRSSDLQDILTKQDKRTQETVDSLIKTKSTLSSIQSELSILKSEKQFMAKVQKELKAENERFSKESVEYKVLIAQLQTLQREREMLLKETQNSYKEKLRKLEIELSGSLERLEEIEKNTTGIASNKEHQYNWFQEKIDKLTSEAAQQKTTLEEKEAQLQKMQSTINEQSAKLKEAEARAQSYTMLSNVDDAQNLVETLRQELEKVNLQLSDSYSQIEHHKTLAEQSVQSVNEVSQAFEEAQKESQKTIITLENERNQLQSTVNILNDQVKDLNNEIFHQKSEYQTERNATMEEISKLQMVKESVDRTKADYEEKIAMIQKDLEMQTQYANESQRSYELELQKHADVSKTITSLRTEAQSYKSDLETLKTQSQLAMENLKNSEKLWNEQKTEYEDKLSVLEQRVQELSTQNKLLYDQIELLNKTEDRDNSHDSSDLLISLRRERDMLETKLEVALSEQTVLKQRLDIAKSEIEDLNTQLSQVKNSSSESAHLLEQQENIMKELDQLHLLRESNVTLRSENSSFKKECDNLKSQLQECNDRLAPLQSSISSLQNGIKIKEQELIQSKEEAERWKSRSQDILHKYERIDPEEHGKLKEEINDVKNELQTTKDTLQSVIAEKDDWESKFQRIRLQARDRLNASKEKEQSLSSEINQINEAKSQVEADLGKCKTACKELEERLQVVTQEAETKEQTFNSQLSKLQEDLHSIQVQMENASKTEQNNADSDEKIKSLTETVEMLNSKIQELEAEASNAQKIVAEHHTPVINEDTKSIVDNLKTEFEAEKEQLIKDKEKELRSKFEAEKESAWNSREEELRKQFEEREKRIREECEKTTVQSPSQPTLDIDIDALKNEWEKEYEKQTLEKIKLAEEALKKRIRLPTQQKIDKIVEARKAVLEESFEEKVNEKAQKLAGEIGNDAITLEKHRAELNALKDSMRKQFEADLAEIKQKSFEEGKQQVSLKLKFLESKIRNLEQQKSTIKPVENDTSNMSAAFQAPVFGSHSTFTSPFSTSEISPNKRPIDDTATEQPEKRHKEPESDTEDGQEA